MYCTVYISYRPRKGLQTGFGLLQSSVKESEANGQNGEGTLKGEGGIRHSRETSHQRAKRRDDP